MKKILLLCLVFLTACGSIPSDPAEPLNSGFELQVLIGPMCPVMQVGQECPDQPYQATLTVLNSRGQEVYQFTTDEQGKFKGYLEPGDYTLRPDSPQNMPLPRAGEQAFTVEPNKFTKVTVNYDSGIR